MLNETASYCKLCKNLVRFGDFGQNLIPLENGGNVHFLKVCFNHLGGVMAHSIREDAYSNSEYGYEGRLKEMEEAGKIKLLKKERTVKYAHETASEYTVPHTYILIYQIIKH